MGKFDDVIIGSDLDGTFYCSNKDSYEKNINAIEYFKANGGLFTFVTGRDLFSLNAVIKNVKEIVNTPVILANGSRLYDYNTDKFVIDINLNLNKFKKFIQILYEKYPDIGIRISYDEGFYIPVENEMIKKDLGNEYSPMSKLLAIDDMDENIHKVCKAVIVHAPEILEEVKKCGEAFDLENEFFFTKSYLTGLELVNSKSSKGLMLKMLRDVHLKQHNRKIYAIGDYHNDYDMIQSADYGVCPENAAEEIKQIAKIRTVHCEEGAIADLIKIIEKNKN